MASTANNITKRFEAAQIITSFMIDENNNAMDDADTETPGSGFFLAPSVFTARGTDVTGFPVTCATSQGKFAFTDPNAFGATILFTDLGDVTLTGGLAANDILTYTGTVWQNSNDATVTTLVARTTADIDGTIGFYGTTPVARPAISIVNANFDADTSGSLSTGTETYNGYTLEGIVANLNALGLIPYDATP